MQIMNKQEVVAELHVSDRTLEIWVRDGKFPKPVRIGKQACWTREAVERWKNLAFAFQLEFNPS
jgi:prophage regulatory protein